LFLALTGGEPLLHPEALEIAQAAVARHFFVRLKTNGTLFDSTSLAQWIDCGVQQVDLSLYHVDPAKHDAFVGQTGALKKTMRTARALRDQGVAVDIGATVMNWNAPACSSLIDFFEAEGLRYSFETDVCVRNDGNRAPCAERATDEQIAAVLRDPRFNRDLETCSRESLFEMDDPICGAGASFVLIMPDGDVRLCQRLPMSLGNVLEQPLRELWPTSPERRRFTSLKVKDFRRCATCSLAAACNHCPASALLETGDLLSATDEECRLARLQRASRT
jgi:radical SAM protein with 4Fe4S-binding SPASM domain